MQGSSRAASLLVSLFLSSQLARSASPPKLPTTNEPTEHRFQWVVTTFSSHDQSKSPYRESSDRYLSRIRADPASSHEYLHTLHPQIRPGNADELAAKITKAHKHSLLNDNEYQVLKNNVFAKAKGLLTVQNGHPVRIGNSVHHPAAMHPETVAYDFKTGKMANVLLTPVKGVKDKFRGDAVHAMTLLEAPPKYDSRHDGKGKEPVAHDNTQSTPVISQGKQSQQIASWHVTSRYTRKDGKIAWKTEPVKNYRQRSMQKEAHYHAQGIHQGIHSYVYTPHPQFNDPIHHPRLLPNLLHSLHQSGYPAEKLQLVHDNMHHLTEAFKHIRNGGVVHFPDSIHHPEEMHPIDAVKEHGDTKVGHVKVTVLPGDHTATPGANHRLVFEPWPPLVLEAGDHSDQTATTRKRPLEHFGPSSSYRHRDVGPAERRQRQE